MLTPNHVSHVKCHVLRVTFHVLCATNKEGKEEKNRQSDGVSQWRVCYQQAQVNPAPILVGGGFVINWAYAI